MQAAWASTPAGFDRVRRGKATTTARTMVGGAAVGGGRRGLGCRGGGGVAEAYKRGRGRDLGEGATERESGSDSPSWRRRSGLLPSGEEGGGTLGLGTASAGRPRKLLKKINVTKKNPNK